MAAFRYYRWTITARKRADTTMVQAGEFTLLNSSTPLSPTSTTGPSDFGHNADHLSDVIAGSKWLDQMDTTAAAAWLVAVSVIFDFGTVTTTTGYRWYTADDAIERDPVTWEVWGSNDSSTWTLLDLRVAYATTGSRETLVGPFTFNNPVAPASPFIRYIKWTTTKRRSSGDSVHVAEFAGTIGGTRTPASLSQQPGLDSGGENLNDNNTSTKWHMSGTTGGQTAPQAVVLDYGFTDPALDGYYWTTANDFDQGDPVSWTVHYSEDLITWTLLDTQTDYATTTSRNTLVGPFVITPPAPPAAYTELEWSIGIQALAVEGDVYEFRVFYDDADTPLDTYAVTPQLTIATAGIDLVVANAVHAIGKVGVSDDFNRSDRTLGDDADWIEIQSSTARQLQIVSNAVTGEEAGRLGRCVWTTPAISNEQFAEADVDPTLVPTGDHLGYGPVVCADTTPQANPNDSGYSVYFRLSDGRFSLWKGGTGVVTLATLGAFSAPLRLRLETEMVEGSFHVRVLRDGVGIIDYVDATPLTGLYFGVQCAGLVARVDNWAGGDFSQIDVIPDLTVANATHVHSPQSVALDTGIVPLPVRLERFPLTGERSTRQRATALDRSHVTADFVLAIVMPLSDERTITVANAVHTQPADNVALQLELNLTVADAAHAHTADNVVLTLPPSYNPFVLANITNLDAGTPSVTDGVLSSSWGSHYGRLIFRPDSRNANDCYFEVVVDRSEIDGSGGTDYWALITNADSSGNGGLRVMIQWGGHNPSTADGMWMGTSNGWSESEGTMVRLNPDPAGWTNAGPHTVGFRHEGNVGTVVLDGVDVFRNTSTNFGTYKAGGYVGFGGDPGGTTRVWQGWDLDELGVPTFDLVVANSTHGLTSDNLAVGIEGDWFVTNGVHVHTAGTVTLTRVSDLVVANSTHTSVSDNVPLHIVTTLTQEGFRWRRDDGSETTASWVAAQDADAFLDINTPARLRVLLDINGDPPPTDYALYFKKSTDSTWQPVPIGAATTGPVYVALSPNIPTAGGATTALLAPPASKTTADFSTGGIWDDQNGGTPTLVPANGLHSTTSQTPVLLPEGPVELLVQVGAPSISPWVGLQSGSTATITWKNSAETTLATGGTPTITRPADGIVKMYVTDGGLPAMNKVDFLNLGFDSSQDAGGDNIGSGYNWPGQPVLNIAGIQLLTGMRYFMAANTPLATSLNLTGMTNLLHVECFDSALTSLTLTGCTSLIRICVESTAVDNLDFSACKNVLHDLRCANGNPVNPVYFFSDGPLTTLYHYCVRNEFFEQHLTMAQLPVVEQWWTSGTGITTMDMPISPAINSIWAEMNFMESASLDNFLIGVANNGPTGGYQFDLQDSYPPTSASDAARANLIAGGWPMNFPLPGTLGGDGSDGTWTPPTHQPWVIGDLSFEGTASVTGGVLTHNTSGYQRLWFNPGGRSTGDVFFEVMVDQAQLVGSNWGFITNTNSTGHGGLRVFIQWNLVNPANANGISVGQSNQWYMYGNHGTVERVASNPAGWGTAGNHKVGIYHGGDTMYIVLDGVKVYKSRGHSTDVYQQGGYVGFGGDSGGTNRIYQSWGIADVTL